MGRPRKPTKVLEMRGSFDKDPQRRKAREHEPKVGEPLGDPPQYFNEALAARWLEIADSAYWLRVTHRGLVEQTCLLWQTMRDGKPDHKSLAQCWSKLGMTPVDESRVVAPEAKPKSKVEKYAS